MVKVKVRKVGNSLTVTLPAALVDALHLHEQDEMAIEQVGERLVLTRVDQDYTDAWQAYESIEPRYRNANRRLAK